ncbi:MAG: hypothetical protein NTU98_12390 [Bacteroidetes bacterium]|nr:hypothetical protein [Bacteroidota bacterium]
MAIVDNNIVSQGLRGKVGNLVFRKRGNKTTAYVLSPRGIPLSQKQKAAQMQFSAAVRLAVAALNDATMRKKFEKMAKNKKKESAYSAAITFYLNQDHNKKS